jgi:hypothetical protein
MNAHPRKKGCTKAPRAKTKRKKPRSVQWWERRVIECGEEIKNDDGSVLAVPMILIDPDDWLRSLATVA